MKFMCSHRGQLIKFLVQTCVALFVCWNETCACTTFFLCMTLDRTATCILCEWALNLDIHGNNFLLIPCGLSERNYLISLSMPMVQIIKKIWNRILLYSGSQHQLRLPNERLQQIEQITFFNQKIPGRRLLAEPSTEQILTGLSATMCMINLSKLQFSLLVWLCK